VTRRGQRKGEEERGKEVTVFISRSFTARKRRRSNIRGTVGKGTRRWGMPDHSESRLWDKGVCMREEKKETPRVKRKKIQQTNEREKNLEDDVEKTPSERPGKVE